MAAYLSYYLGWGRWAPHSCSYEPTCTFWERPVIATGCALKPVSRATRRFQAPKVGGDSRGIPSRSQLPLCHSVPLNCTNIGDSAVTRRWQGA